MKINSDFRTKRGRPHAAVLAFLAALAASLVLLSPDLAAKDRRGAKLEVTCRDGRRLIGELVAVKSDSLLLAQEYSGLDTSIAIANVRRVRIVKKSKAGKWGTTGAVIGFCGGALRGYGQRDPYRDDEMWPLASIYYGMLYGLGGLLAGGIGGALMPRGDTLTFEGSSQAEVDLMLGKLRRLALVTDFR